MNTQHHTPAQETDINNPSCGLSILPVVGTLVESFAIHIKNFLSKLGREIMEEQKNCVNLQSELLEVSLYLHWGICETRSAEREKSSSSVIQYCTYLLVSPVLFELMRIGID